MDLLRVPYTAFNVLQGEAHNAGSSPKSLNIKLMEFWIVWFKLKVSFLYDNTLQYCA